MVVANHHLTFFHFIKSFILDIVYISAKLSYLILISAP